MSLTDAYVLPHKRISAVFSKIREGQAPERVTTQLIRDWGFKSTNDRAFIRLLKEIGFLTADGAPTQRYHNYRDHSQSRIVMGEALKEAYGDIFLITAHPTTTSDSASITGKFKSYHNTSDNVADLMSKTFFGLLELGDLDASATVSSNGSEHSQGSSTENTSDSRKTQQIRAPSNRVSGLHYNIQIHLPATKDVEVYSSIFKSLKEHLLEE